MKLLVVNNFVRYGSGVDGVVRLERDTLSKRGHHVALFQRDNYDLDRADGVRKASLLSSCIYSFPARAELTSILRRAARSESGPFDVIHVHNTVPLMTGAVWDACRESGVPTVQHLHNYRAFCLSSYSYRDGQACDACRASAFTACALHACYRDSHLLSTGLLASRLIDWSRGRRSGYGAGGFVACSEWVKRRHVEHGLPAERIEVVHNAANDLAWDWAGCDNEAPPGRCAPVEKTLVFVGTLLKAKGVYRVLDLAQVLTEFQFRFVGTGDEDEALKHEAERRRLTNVSFEGILRPPELQAVWAPSFLSLVPSEWEDPFPLVAPESLSLGVPVMTSGAGGLAEAVADGVTGLVVDFGDPRDAAERVRQLWGDPARYGAMCAAARRVYEERYTRPVFAERLEGALERLGDLSRRQEAAREARRPYVAPVARSATRGPAARPRITTTRLRVLIDGHMLGTHETGNETYVRGLLEGLSEIGAPQIVAVRAGSSADVGTNRPLPLSAGSGNVSRLLAGLPALAHRTGVSVLHGTYVVPPVASCARVVTIHDVSFSRHPDMFTPRDRTVLGLGVRMSARVAERIIVPSEHARNEVLDLLHVSEERVVVTPEGVSPRFRPHTQDETRPVLTALGIDRPYVLAVGNLEPRKNLARLLEAWAIAASQCGSGEVLLVLAGSAHGLGEDIRLAAERLRIKSSVRTTGWVADDALPPLYAAALGFVYPSLYEGFGLPVVEAMASGTPVTCSSASSVPEVAGDAALLVNPYDIDDIAAGLVTIINDDTERRRLAALGLERARQFTWAKCARATMDVYVEALAERVAHKTRTNARDSKRMA